MVELAHGLYGVYRCASALGHTEEAETARLHADSIAQRLNAPLFTWILGPREEPGAQAPVVVDL